MADAKLTALTAAGALAAADLFYVSQSAASRKATGTQLLTLVGTTYVPLAGGATMTGALTIASGTLTASAPALSITQTWNAGAVAFNALLVNITDTSSAAESLLMDLQVSGASKFSVRKDGLLVRLGGANATIDSTGRLVVGNSTYDTSIGSLWTVVANTGALRASVRSYPLSFGTDVILLGDAANTLAQRNGTNAQTFKVYGTTDAGLTNYERLAISAQQGVGFTIGAETLGTGGDNLDIVLTPAGTGAVQVKSGLIAGASTLESAALAYGGEYGMRMFSSAALRWTAGNIAAGADTAMRRSAAGVVAIDNGTAGTYRDLIARNVRTDPVAFASLVAAATAGNGARAMITNCSHATFGTAADGGGSTKVPVYSDGASWLVG